MIGQTRPRSPSVPCIGLYAAIHRAHEVYQSDRLNPLTPSQMAAIWRVAPGSSRANRTIAALRAYGLIQNCSEHQIRVSDLMEELLNVPYEAEAQQRIHVAAALRPKLIADCAARWRGGRSADRICITELQTSHRFTEAAAAAFLPVFDEAMFFAGGGLSGFFPAFPDIPSFTSEITIGDYVRLPAKIAGDLPQRRVVWLADGGGYLYLEKSLIRFPVSAVTRINASPGYVPPKQRAGSRTAEPNGAAKPTRKSAGHRVSFPRIQLPVALGHTRELIRGAGRQWVSITDAAKLWCTRPSARDWLWVAHALREFGFAEQQGHGKSRKIRVSELGWRIIDRPGTKTSQDALREAISKMKLIAHYAREWQRVRPSTGTCIKQLVREQGFPPGRAQLFLAVFDQCVDFLMLQGDPAAADSGSAVPSPPVIVENQPLPRSDLSPSATFPGVVENRPVSPPEVLPPRSSPVLVESSVLMAADLLSSHTNVLNIEQHGKHLEISADLDLAGLRQFKKMLPHYQAILELLVPMQS